jgi:hypothetical protein
MPNSKSYVLFDIEARTFVGGSGPIFFNDVASAEAHIERLRSLEAYRPDPRQYDLVAVRGS